MTNKEAADELKCYHYKDGSVPEEIILAIKALEDRPQDDLIKAFELLKEHCKNRECNKDCVFYRELRIGDTIDHQYCGLCEIVLNDDEEVENDG